MVSDCSSKRCINFLFFLPLIKTLVEVFCYFTLRNTQNVFSVLHGARACIEGVKAATVLGMGEIVLETDAAQVVEALFDNGFRLSDGRRHGTRTEGTPS